MEIAMNDPLEQALAEVKAARAQARDHRGRIRQGGGHV